MRVIGLAGFSGAGKTTLLLKLLPLFGAAGLRVSTLKHAHHAFEIDVPGKDSFEHRRAGAHEVLVASSGRVALVQELRGAPEPPLPALIGRLSPVDLVVIEGFKAWDHTKIEVHRQANGKPWLYPVALRVAGIATDAAAPADFAGPVVALDDAGAVMRLMLQLAEPVGPLIARLSALPVPDRLGERAAKAAVAGGVCPDAAHGTP
jgi:molybdopterin-guanine dinucleotide biosynthesis protein B